MIEFPKNILQHLAKSGVVATFSVERVEHAVPTAEALLAGGIDAIELTLRTPVATQAVREICLQVPEMLVGVGTILTPEMAVEVKQAGADFGVSPGMNARVIRKAQEIGLPFAPGIATPTELEAAIELGCRLVKVFPAESLGGIEYLRALAAPYQSLGIQYFPLGGINAENMVDYLRQGNVPTVGGSWIVQNELVENEDWTSITLRAAEVRANLSDESAAFRDGGMNSAEAPQRNVNLKVAGE